MVNQVKFPLLPVEAAYTATKEAMTGGQTIPNDLPRFTAVVTINDVLSGLVNRVCVKIENEDVNCLMLTTHQYEGYCSYGPVVITGPVNKKGMSNCATVDFNNFNPIVLTSSTKDGLDVALVEVPLNLMSLLGLTAAVLGPLAETRSVFVRTIHGDKPHLCPTQVRPRTTNTLSGSEVLSCRHAHNAPTTVGCSGSPVMQGPLLVGIHIGSFQTSQAFCNTFTDVSFLLSILLGMNSGSKEWPGPTPPLNPQKRFAQGQDLDIVVGGDGSKNIIRTIKNYLDDTGDEIMIARGKSSKRKGRYRDNKRGFTYDSFILGRNAYNVVATVADPMTGGLSRRIMLSALNDKGQRVLFRPATYNDLEDFDRTEDVDDILDNYIDYADDMKEAPKKVLKPRVTETMVKQTKDTAKATVVVTKVATNGVTNVIVPAKAETISSVKKSEPIPIPKVVSRVVVEDYKPNPLSRVAQAETSVSEWVLMSDPEIVSKIVKETQVPSPSSSPDLKGPSPLEQGTHSPSCMSSESTLSQVQKVSEKSPAVSNSQVLEQPGSTSIVTQQSPAKSSRSQKRSQKKQNSQASQQSNSSTSLTEVPKQNAKALTPTQTALSAQLMSLASTMTEQQINSLIVAATQGLNELSKPSPKATVSMTSR